MFKGDMNKKRAKALQKVKEAITLHGGQTDPTHVMWTQP